MRRRALTVVVCLAPVALCIASLLSEPRPAAPWAGIPLALAGAIAGFNFHLSFVRPWLYRRRHGSLEGYRFVSGLPGIATVIVVLTTLFQFGAHAVAAIGLVILAIDTGGLLWFAIATWRD